MKKTGIGIYFIALWFFVAYTFLIYPLFDNIASYRSAGLSLPFLVQGLWLVAAVALVAELVGLVLLHPISRWLYICVIVFWSFVIAGSLYKDFAGEILSSRHLIWSLLFLVINFYSIGYLIRPKFREMCRQQRQKRRLSE